MKTTISNISKILLMGMATTFGPAGCQPGPQTGFTLEQQGDTLTLVHIAEPARYLLLPVEERSAEGQVCLVTGDPADTDMDIRLAKEKTDYFVPFELPAGAAKATVRIRKTPQSAICWKEMKLSDTFDTANRDKFRPIYHHTPLYGWMNDANGLVYKDGEYHLYFQYNPYGSVWGNMHWGHSVSRDLVHWEHRPVALARDTMGHIFSGSSVVDAGNTAGYGAGAIVSFYTSASDKNGQIQCMAHSNDNGRTFAKYEKNPVLTPFDGLKDFRDPKVFWYAPEEKWVMIVSADKEMRFYSSDNLKDWTYMSAFGEGYGVQPSQFECPDMVELPVNGDEADKRWALIVNINPGCLFGGSATQYFTGRFDGTRFTCDTEPQTVKWLDWGKDHYATVCFSNTPGRVIAMPWMSNWQYANIVPTQQFRSANALPRELTMYSEGKDIYLAVNPVKEAEALRKETKAFPAFTVEAGREVTIDTLFAGNDGAFEIEMNLSTAGTEVAGLRLANSRGEHTDIYLDRKAGKLVMDRVHSGIVDFGKNSVPHEKEAHDNRIANSINYVDDFALATWGPLSDKAGHTLRILADKCSIEIFLDGGKVAMTNLVFPNEPYNTLQFYSQGGSYRVNSLNLYKLAL